MVKEQFRETDTAKKMLINRIILTNMYTTPDL